MTKQKPSIRKKLRSAAAKKGWAKRRLAERAKSDRDFYELVDAANRRLSARSVLREPTPEELASQRAGWAKSCVTVDVTKAADPNPWPRLAAWVKRVLRIGK